MFLHLRSEQNQPTQIRHLPAPYSQSPRSMLAPVVVDPHTWENLQILLYSGYGPSHLEEVREENRQGWAAALPQAL